MSEGRVFDNPDFLAYLRLLHELHAAIREGRDESAEGERIRDRMDEPASRLTSDEIDSVHGISGDFYSVTDPLPAAIRPRTAEVEQDLAEVSKARASNDFNRALNLLRRCALYMEPAALAFQRGKIWMEAGEPDIAGLFLERAVELDPDNPQYRSVALAR